MEFTLTTVITTINGRIDYLKRAIESVANQILIPNKLIIISQRLEDKDLLAVDILCQSLDLNFQHIKFPELIGSQLARYYGLLKTSTKYIHFLDDDDFIYPEMYLMAKELFLSYKNINLLSFNAKYLKADFTNKKNKIEILTKRNSGFIKKSDLIISNKIGPTSGAIIFTDILRKIDSFNPQIKLRQDYSNWLLISQENGLIYTSSELGFYYETDSKSSILKNIFKNGFSVASVWKIRFRIFNFDFYTFLFALMYDLKFLIAKLFERLQNYDIFNLIAIMLSLLISFLTYFFITLYLFIKYYFQILKGFIINFKFPIQF